MPTYAAATDVAARWGKDPNDLDAALTTLIETRLDDAERMIARSLKRLGRTIEDDITADTYSADDVIQVESEAVLRLARNPEGYLSEGDGNYTYMLMQDISSGKLDILPEEWDILGVSSSGMFFIDPNPVLGT